MQLWWSGERACLPMVSGQVRALSGEKSYFLIFFRLKFNLKLKFNFEFLLFLLIKLVAKI